VSILNQVLGVRKGVNTTAGRRFVEVASTAAKSQLVNGMTREYAPKDDDGEQLPGEFQKVQVNIFDLNKELVSVLSRQWDINATVDNANTYARADIEVPNGPTIRGVPVTTLMYLEKQLSEVASYIARLPVLDPSIDWEYDTNSGIFRSETVKTHRTTKVQKPIVLYPATDKHAAQTQMVVEDQIAGYWSTTRLSGALPEDVRKAMIARVNAVKEAVVRAREVANTVTVDDTELGAELLGFVFGP